MPVSFDEKVKILYDPKRREEAVALIDEWLADDSGYDEAVWPIVREAILQGGLTDGARSHLADGD